MELRPGIPSVSRAVPALQLVAEHEHVRQRVHLHAQRLPAGRRILVERYGELEQAVVQQYRGERVHVLFADLIRTERIAYLAVESGGAEIRVVHIVSESVRADGLVVDRPQHVLFRKAVDLAQLFGDAEGEQFLRGIERAAVELLELSFCFVPEPGYRVDVAESDEQAAFAAFAACDLVIRQHLLERKLKGIAYIVEQRRKSPELQETVSCGAVRFGVGLVGREAVELLELSAVYGV